ncbi:MAG: hypothetical protein HC808_10170 [Candidatus Competibacteraceae bacterium]|nr:hypothetical protein [Candidatus Competibacteraceae bacterium]
MSQRWLNTVQRALQQVHALIALFYYRKYFEWGLPTRRFVQVNIETNTVCNRTCHFCLYGIKDEVPANPMSAGLFFKIIDQLAEMKFVGRISLFSTNEPLTDKRIYEFIRYASLMLPSSCHSLVSNGDLLNRERLDRLFDSGLDLLLINSYDEEALKQNRELVEYARSQHPDKILHTDRTVYTDWVSRAGHIEQYGKTLDQGYCDLPNYALYINPKGHVLSCCHDFDSQNQMGDLTRQSVKEAWYGQQFPRSENGSTKATVACRSCVMAVITSRTWRISNGTPPCPR